MDTAAPEAFSQNVPAKRTEKQNSLQEGLLATTVEEKPTVKRDRNQDYLDATKKTPEKAGGSTSDRETILCSKGRYYV